MFSHVVLFWMKDKRPEHFREVAEKLLTLKAQVPSIVDMEVGIDDYRSERSADICLIVRFTDAAGERAYQAHPYHQQILAYMRERTEKSLAADFGALA